MRKGHLCTQLPWFVIIVTTEIDISYGDKYDPWTLVVCFSSWVEGVQRHVPFLASKRCRPSRYMGPRSPILWDFHLDLLDQSEDRVRAVSPSAILCHQIMMLSREFFFNSAPENMQFSCGTPWQFAPWAMTGRSSVMHPAQELALSDVCCFPNGFYLDPPRRFATKGNTRMNVPGIFDKMQNHVLCVARPCSHGSGFVIKRWQQAGGMMAWRWHPKQRVGSLGNGTYTVARPAPVSN